MIKLKTVIPEKPEKILEGTELVKALCEAFGPTGSEEDAAKAISSQLYGTSDVLYSDRYNNLFCVIKGGGKGYDADNPKKLMLSAHMDEVGFMVTDIDSDGYVKFAILGGIDSRVLCGRHLTMRGDRGFIHGIIASKAIHLQSSDERANATKADSMYIDIGARNREEAGEWLQIGDSGTFDSDFVYFGQDDAYMKSKALDDRFGCAVIIETARRLKKEGKKLPFDIICAFTGREEIGNSGATMAAGRWRPDYAIVLETTAIADLPDVNENSRVAEVGKGGVISVADRSTIYDVDFVRGTLAIAEKQGIPAQVKRYVSGGNDAGHIHKTAAGCRCLAVSAATRYLHSASCVASVEDYKSIKSLIYSVVTGYEFA